MLLTKLKKTFTPHDTCQGFKTTEIWPFNLNAMENKIQPNGWFVDMIKTPKLEVQEVDLHIEDILIDKSSRCGLNFCRTTPHLL